MTSTIVTCFVDPTIKPPLPQKKQTCMYLSLHEFGDYVWWRLISKDCLSIAFILQIAAGAYPLQANAGGRFIPLDMVPSNDYGAGVIIYYRQD